VTKSEVEAILDKISTVLPNMESSSVPPFTYQLLLFAANTHVALIIQMLEQYFKDVKFDEEIGGMLPC